MSGERKSVQLPRARRGKQLGCSPHAFKLCKCLRACVSWYRCRPIQVFQRRGEGERVRWSKWTARMDAKGLKWTEEGHWLWLHRSGEENESAEWERMGRGGETSYLENEKSSGPQWWWMCCRPRHRFLSQLPGQTERLGERKAERGRERRHVTLPLSISILMPSTFHAPFHKLPVAVSVPHYLLSSQHFLLIIWLSLSTVRTHTSESSLLENGRENGRGGRGGIWESKRRGKAAKGGEKQPRGTCSQQPAGEK